MIIAFKSIVLAQSQYVVHFEVGKHLKLNKRTKTVKKPVNANY